MTLGELFPYHNRLVNFTTYKGGKGCGVFLDIIGYKDKLFPEEVYFVTENYMGDFKRFCDNVPVNSIEYKTSLDVYATKVDLTIIKTMELKINKIELISKWKDAFKDTEFVKKHRLAMRLDKVKEGVRDLEIGSVMLRISPGKITLFNDDNSIQAFPITNEEYQELFDLYEIYSG